MTSEDGWSLAEKRTYEADPASSAHASGESGFHNLIADGGMHGGLWPSFLAGRCPSSPCTGLTHNGGMFEVVADEEGSALLFTNGADLNSAGTRSDYLQRNGAHAGHRPWSVPAVEGQTFSLRLWCKAAQTAESAVCNARAWLMDDPYTSYEDGATSSAMVSCAKDAWAAIQVEHTVGPGATALALRLDISTLSAHCPILMDDFQLQDLGAATTHNLIGQGDMLDGLWPSWLAGDCAAALLKARSCERQSSPIQV